MLPKWPLQPEILAIVINITSSYNIFYLQFYYATQRKKRSWWNKFTMHRNWIGNAFFKPFFCNQEILHKLLDAASVSKQWSARKLVALFFWLKRTHSANGQNSSFELQRLIYALFHSNFQLFTQFSFSGLLKICFNSITYMIHY